MIAHLIAFVWIPFRQRNGLMRIVHIQADLGVVVGQKNV